jgi:hypothetical protein
MATLVKAGYRGFMSPEIANDPSDPGLLRTISEELDKILRWHSSRRLQNINIMIALTDYGSSY